MYWRRTLAEFEAESAGTIAYDGSFPSAGSVEVMHETFGLDIDTDRARSVTWDAEADLIQTMDRRTTDEIKALGVKFPVEILGDFSTAGEEVDNPCGGSRRAYRRVAEQLV